MARLICRKGYGDISLYAQSVHGTLVARYSARHIYRHYRSGRIVDRRDRGSIDAAGSTRKAGAEYCVNNQVCVIYILTAKCFIIAEIDRSYTKRHSLCKHFLCAVGCGRFNGYHPYMRAVFKQLSCDNIAVTAVVAFAADDNDPFTLKLV